MKKRIIAIALVLMLAVSLLPASAFAADGIFVSVGDKEFTGLDQTISVGGGKATLTHVSQMNFKLTLENVNLTSFSKIGTDSGVTYYAGIYYVSSCGGDGSLTVELKGNNCITAPIHGSSKVYEGVYSNGAMSFKGDNLTVSGVDIGFDVINNFGETSNPESSRLGFGANNVTVNASDAAVLGEDVSFRSGNCNFCSTGSCCMEAIRSVMGYGGNVSLNFTPDVSNGYSTAAALICHEWCRLENTNLSVNVNYDASGYKGDDEITAFGIYSDNNDITGLGNSKISVNVKLIGGGNCSAVGICCSSVHAYASNGTCSELYSKLSLSGKHLDSSAILATGGMLIEGIGEAAVYGASANDCAVGCFGRIDLNAKSFYAYTDCTAPNYSVIYYEGGNEDDCNKYLTYPENAEFKAVSDDGQVYAVVSFDGKLLNQAVFCNGAYSFRDIDNSNTAPFKDAILWAVDNGITNGITPVEFRPSAQCTRGQVVTFLWRAKGCPEPTITENPFVDVASTSPYYKAILWAYENGITTGIDDTHFKPSNPCTRGQVVTFLWRADGTPAPQSDENPFKDVSKTGKTAPFYEAILWAAENSITTGYSDNTFRPAATCTRGQIVTFIYRDMNE